MLMFIAISPSPHHITLSYLKLTYEIDILYTKDDTTLHHEIMVARMTATLLS